MELGKKTCVAIQTARAGSIGVPNKNRLELNGSPMFSYPLEAALSSKRVTDVWVSTDDSFIIDWCTKSGHKLSIIDRPKSLSSAVSSHHDVMIHALDHIGKRYDYVLLLLGNTVFTKSEDIDLAIEMLENNELATSVLSVTKFNMFNPHRAFIKEGERLKSFVCKQMPENSNDRNAFPSTYFFNGSFCICKYDVMMEKEPSMVYSWIGNNPIAYEQPFAIELDASWQIPIFSSYLEKECH